MTVKGKTRIALMVTVEAGERFADVCEKIGRTKVQVLDAVLRGLTVEQAADAVKEVLEGRS